MSGNHRPPSRRALERLTAILHVMMTRLERATDRQEHAAWRQDRTSRRLVVVLAILAVMTVLELLLIWMRW